MSRPVAVHFSDMRQEALLEELLGEELEHALLESLRIVVCVTCVSHAAALVRSVTSGSGRNGAGAEAGLPVPRRE